MRPVGLVLALSDAGLSELFEARKLVEPGLATLAAERIERRGRRRSCSAARRRAPTRSRTPRRSCGHDIELHAQIARAAYNAVLSRLLESIAGMGIASRRRTGRLAQVREQSAQRPSWRSPPRSRPTTRRRPGRDAAPPGERRTGGERMIERPGKIVAIGLNYMDHVRESGAEPPKRPLVFAKFTTSRDRRRGARSGSRARSPSASTGRSSSPSSSASGAQRASEADALDVRPRLHGRQRRLRPRPAVRRRPVGAREEPGHVLPARPEASCELDDPQNLKLHTRVNGEVDAGLQHRAR